MRPPNLFYVVGVPLLLVASCSEATITEVEGDASDGAVRLQHLPSALMWSTPIEETVTNGYIDYVSVEEYEPDEPDSNYYMCPPRIPTAGYTWRGHDFKFGPWLHNGPRPQSVAPLAGTYRGPTGEFMSQDYKAIVTGPKTLSVKCATRRIPALRVAGLPTLWWYYGYVTFTYLRASFGEVLTNDIGCPDPDEPLPEPESLPSPLPMGEGLAIESAHTVSSCGGGGDGYEGEPSCITVYIDHYWYYPDTGEIEYRYTESVFYCYIEEV